MPVRGGVNGNGDVIAQSGFEPYLSLFDASGNFLASTWSGITCPAGANTNIDSGLCLDVELTWKLRTTADHCA